MTGKKFVRLDTSALRLLAGNLIRKYQQRIAELEQHPETVFDPHWDAPRIERWIEFLGEEYCLTDVIRLRHEHPNGLWEFKKLQQFEAELVRNRKNKRQIKPFVKAIRGLYDKAGMPIAEKWPEHLKQSRARV